MKFVVSGFNVKLMGKAIHCLAKIGDEVYMEPSKDSLALRTVNSSRLKKIKLTLLRGLFLFRSAYAIYSLSSLFFSGLERSLY